MRRTAAAGGNAAAGRRDDTGRSAAGDLLTAGLRAIGLARARLCAADAGRGGAA